MAEKERDRRGRSRTRGNRGTSPMVGIILLFGIVMIGAFMIFVAGSAMFDALESEANREQTQQFMSETDHRLATVADTGKDQPLPLDDLQGSRANITDDGGIEIVWYDGTAVSDPLASGSCTASGDLGSLEFEQDGRTIAHQGGGVWEYTDDGTSIVSEPRIGYDGDSLQLQILQLDEDDLGGSEPVAKADHTEATSLTENISDAAAGCPDGTDVAFRIESSYHDGWHRYLEDALGEDEYSNVTVDHDPANGNVEVYITGIRESQTRTGLLIEDDRGLTNPPPHMAGSQRIEDGSPLMFEAVLNNTDSTAANQQLTVSIDGGAVEKTEPVTVSGDTATTEGVTFGVGEYSGQLTPGHTYQYTTSTANDTLDDLGEFYLGKSGTHFSVTDDDVETRETGDGSVTIATTVRNHGLADGSKTVALEFDDLSVRSEREVTLDYGAGGTVEWTINESAWPGGVHDFTIETEDGDTATGRIVVDGDRSEAAFHVVTDEGVLEEMGTESEQLVDKSADRFTIGTTIENTYSNERTQDVSLSILGEDIDETREVTLASGESDTVQFSLGTDDFDPGTVYEYDITTEDDSLTESGSFYVGEPGSAFEVSDTSTDENDGTIVLSTDLQNSGIETGSPGAVTLDLEHLDGETPDAYDLEPTTVDEEFGFGQRGTLEWELNGSRLLDGEYEATVDTGDAASSTTFNVSIGTDSSETGIGVGEPARANVTVLGSQVSRPPYDVSCGEDCTESRHDLIPLGLSVVTESDGDRTVHHEFENGEGGDNINTYDTWQNKGNDAWTTQIEINEEANLSLASTSSWGSYWAGCNGPWQTTDGGTTHRHCTNVNRDDVWVDADATTGASLQNVRVRDYERDTVPSLRAAHGLQMTADEVLEREGLWDERTDTLDLDESEYVFLFEVTSETNDDGIDALWNDAQLSGDGDPNFNDLIVHVEVERAGVDVSNPYITLTPEPADAPEVDNGNSVADSGGSGDPELSDPSVDNGASPDVGTGAADSTGGGTDAGTNTGVDVDTDHIVIG